MEHRAGAACLRQLSFLLNYYLLTTTSDIQNSYIGYPKYLFRISKIIIPDIRNYAKKVFYLRYPKSFNFGYPKINIYFGYLKLLFWISEIVIFDIQNNYFGYQKLCQKGVLFEISKKLFWISKTTISDIRK